MASSEITAHIERWQAITEECQDLYEFHQGIGEPPTILKDTDTAKALRDAAQAMTEMLLLIGSVTHYRIRSEHRQRAGAKAQTKHTHKIPLTLTYQRTFRRRHDRR